MGIFFERLTCFGDVCIAADILQRNDFKGAAEYLSDFGQLMLVVGCKDNFHA